MKKKFAFLPATLLLTSVLAGCGGGSTPSGGPLVINFWHTFGDTVETEFKNIANDFCRLVKENEGVSLRFEFTKKGNYSEIKTHITDGLGVGEIPTIAVAYPDHVADYLSAGDRSGIQYVVNLQDFIDDPNLTFGTDEYLGDNKGLSDFDPTVLREARSYTKDGTYSLSVLKSTEVMFYNVEIAQAVLPYYNEAYYKPAHGGVALEAGQLNKFFNDCTFKDLMDYSQVALDHRADMDLDPSFVPTLYDSDGNMFITDLLQNGVGYASVNETTKLGQIDFESGTYRTDAEKLITTLRSYGPNGKKLLATKGTLGEYSSNYFKTQLCLFSIGSSGGSGYQFPEAGSFTVGVSRVPNFNTEDPGNNRKYISQGVNLTLLTHPAHKQADKLKLYGWKFLKYVTSTNVNVLAATRGSEGYMPVRTSCLSTNTWQQFMTRGGNYAEVAKIIINEIGDNFLYTPTFKGSASLREYCGGIITSALGDTSQSISSIFSLAIATAKTNMGE